MSIPANANGETRYPLIDKASADTLVVYCSDPRFRAAFSQFVHEKLGVENPILVIVPGGVHDLVMEGRKDAAYHLKDRLGFMLQISGARRLILFDHHDCLWYKRWTGETHDEESERAFNTAAAELGREHPGVQIECYVALLGDGHIRFRRSSEELKSGAS